MVASESEALGLIPMQSNLFSKRLRKIFSVIIKRLRKRLMWFLGVTLDRRTDMTLIIVKKMSSTNIISNLIPLYCTHDWSWVPHHICLQSASRYLSTAASTVGQYTWPGFKHAGVQRLIFKFLYTKLALCSFSKISSCWMPLLATVLPRYLTVLFQ